MSRNRFQALLIISAMVALLSFPSASASTADANLLNVSYDATREFYHQYNDAFAKYWKTKSGQDVTIEMSHGGSGKQARSVIDGLEADVVTLGLAYDIDAIHDKANLLPPDWQSRLPDDSSPYTSTIVFLVRKGNPKHIKNWPDLIKPDIAVVTPNPKTSGGARWAFLAAWGYALKASGGSEDKAKEFVKALYKNVPVLDSGARGSTTTFVERGIGDVLLSWENEAYLATNTLGHDGFQIVYPSISIAAQPPVAWIDKVDRRHGTTDLAKAYLEYLYSEPAQEIAAKNHFRAVNTTVAAKYANQFPTLPLFKVSDPEFGGWANAQKKFFADDGVFDKIYQPGR